MEKGEAFHVSFLLPFPKLTYHFWKRGKERSREEGRKDEKNVLKVMPFTQDPRAERWLRGHSGSCTPDTGVLLSLTSQPLPHDWTWLELGSRFPGPTINVASLAGPALWASVWIYRISLETSPLILQM